MIRNQYLNKTITLNTDDREVAVRELSSDLSAMSFLLERIKATGPVPQDLAFNILSLREARLGELCKLLGVEMDNASAREERFAEIRNANNRIRELERELGNSGSGTKTSAHLKLMTEKLDAWWNRYGFGYISKTSFQKYGLEIEFSCGLFGRKLRVGSSTPASDRVSFQEWVAELRERGFELLDEEGESTPSLADTENNRRLLTELLLTAFPSAKLSKTENHFSRNGDCVLRSILVWIGDLNEVSELPLSAE